MSHPAHSEHSRDAVQSAAFAEPAQTLLACINAYAARQSNPVLALADTANGFVSGRKYPADPLRFGGLPLRAFYHCHAAPGAPAAEHGHFHVFVQGDASAGKWSHLAALSMDRTGQPMSWFAVNRWVTDGTWLPVPVAAQWLQQHDQGGEFDLLETWLFAMLAVYADEIVDLLRRRDRTLTEIKATRSDDDILRDRDVYEFARSPINLLDKLSGVITLSDS